MRQPSYRVLLASVSFFLSSFGWLAARDAWPAALLNLVAGCVAGGFLRQAALRVSVDAVRAAKEGR